MVWQKLFRQSIAWREIRDVTLNKTYPNVGELVTQQRRVGWRDGQLIAIR